MNTAKYLKIVGIFELVSSIIGIIYGFILVISYSCNASWVKDTYGLVTTVGGTILAWILFFVLSFFAPSIGILFLAVSELVIAKHTFRTLKREKKMSPLDRATTLRDLDDRLMKGLITKEEYDRKKMI